MNRFAIRILLVIAIACSTALVVAQPSPVGKWRGKLEINKAKLPKPKNAEEKKQLDAGTKLILQTVFELDLRKDSTFSASVVPSQGPKQVTTGKWKYSPGTLSTQGTILNGKPIPAKELKWRTMVVSKDGKTLSREIEESNGLLKIVFKRS